MKIFLQKNKWMILTLTLFALYLWKLPLQTQDGPNHKKVAVILERLPQSPVENAVYKSNLSPFQTNELFPLLYLSASRFVSVDTYEKIFVGFFLILLPIAYRYFLSVWSPGSLSLWVIILPLWFHPLFIQGMYNFMASVPLTLFALGFLKKGMDSRRLIFLFPFTLCCYLAFLAHPFPFFVLSLCGLILALQEGRSKIFFSILYGLILLFFLFLGFFLPLYHSSGQARHIPYRFENLAELLAGLFINNFIGYSIPQILVLVPFGLLLVGLFILSSKQSPWKYKIYWIALLIAYVFFPGEGSGGAFLNHRFLLFAWAFLPLGLPLPSFRIRQIQIVSMATVLFLAGAVYHGMAQIRTITQNTQSLLNLLPDQSRLNFINFDTNGPALNYSSLYHLWASYEDSKVVFSPNLFAHINLMPLSRRIPSSPTYFPSVPEVLPGRIAKDKICQKEDLLDTQDCESQKNEALKKVLQAAFSYDYWLIYNPPPIFLRILESLPGLKKIAEEKNISLWHYEDAKPFTPPLPFHSSMREKRPSFVQKTISKI